MLNGESIYKRWRVLQRRKYTPEEVYLRYCQKHKRDPDQSYLGTYVGLYPIPRVMMVNGRLAVDPTTGGPMTWDEIDARRKNRRK